MMDMAEHREDETQRWKQRLTLALRAAKICVFEVDLIRQRYTFFENAEGIFGISGEDILRDVRQYSNLKPEEYRDAVSAYFSHPGDQAAIEKAFDLVLRGESTTYNARMKAGNSEYVWCKIDVSPVVEENVPTRMIGVITNISPMKKEADALKERVNFDSFTQLYNKEYAISAMKNILSFDATDQHALLLLDIDNFKVFNDSKGHLEGDHVLKMTSELIKNTFRQSDIMGRFGGDEFIILVKKLPGYEWLEERLNRLCYCENGEYSISNSIGVAFYPQDGTEFDELFEKADQALYDSKIEKGRYTMYTDIKHTDQRNGL